MKLKYILKNIEILSIVGSTDIEISGIEYDSRNIKKGNLFVCIDGSKVDGHKFIESSKTKGAVAFLVEKNIKKDDGFTYVKVKDTNGALSILGKNFYDNPSEKLCLIGVTGTNGKTSVASFLKDMLNVDSKCGFIGTTGIEDGKDIVESKNTTPNSLEIQKNLSNMHKNGCRYCAMEVSSHALSLKRVENLNYEIGIFTNLTEDHLDFHKTFENYRKAKESLFYKTSKVNIINIDDINGRIILENIKNLNVPCITYGINYEATFTGKNVKLYEDKTVAVIGGGNTALQYALELTKYAAKIYICTNEDSLRGEEAVRERVLNEPKIEIRTNFTATSFDGNVLKQDKGPSLTVDGIFVAIGYKTNTDYFDVFKNKGCFLTDINFNRISPNQKFTNIYAVGDCRYKPFNQVVIAMSEGCQAALSIIRDLEK